MKTQMYEARVTLKVTTHDGWTHDDISEAIQRNLKYVDDGSEPGIVVEMNGADTVCDLSTRKLTFYPAQDQGLNEIIAIVHEMTGAEIDVTDEPHGTTIECDPDTMIKITAMSEMINLMSPGGEDMTTRRAALRRLQRLINGNLGCIEPKLEPYTE